MISNHFEPTFARLRYSLEGDRPSQTTHHAMSQSLIQSYWLDIRLHKSGISIFVSIQANAQTS